MAKAWSLRYAATRLRLAVDEVVAHMSSATTATFQDAVAKGVEAYNKNLTTVIYLTGNAMAPTLNPTALSNGKPAIDRLLMRVIPRPSSKTLNVGDVVAFTLPFALPEAKNVLVRRVAAMEGEELVADDTDESSLVIPEGHCWVLADNESLEPPDVIDSRSFGPLPMEHVLGRILYYARSASDHGAVTNSDAALAADAAVLQAELDVEQLMQD